MPDYKQTDVTGTQWQRCNCVHIDNAHGKVPMVTLQEETVATVNGATYIQVGDAITFPFDPAEVIELRNPQTNELLGSSATGMDTYIILYSLYIQRAMQRDEAILQTAALALALEEAPVIEPTP